MSRKGNARVVFPALPEQAFDIVYADPPWDYKGQLQHAGPGSGDSGGAVRHYPTVTLDDLKTLPVADIAADNSLLSRPHSAPMFRSTWRSPRSTPSSQYALAAAWWNSPSSPLSRAKAVASWARLVLGLRLMLGLGLMLRCCSSR